MKVRLSNCFILCMLVTLLFGTTVFASEQSKEEEVISLEEVAKYQTNKARTGNPNEIVITDPEAIKELAAMEGFPDVENIKRLTYTVGKIETEETDSVQLRSVSSWNVIGNVVDQGTGYRLEGHFNENRYQGPMSATYTYTRKDSCTFNSDIGIKSDIVSAKVGFTIGKEIIQTDSIQLSVPAGKKILLKVWTNYQKKSFTVYREYSNCVGLWYPEGSGNAYQPVGLIFTQAEY